MDPEEYDIMFRVEDRHWWYVGLRALMGQFWLRFGLHGRLQVLDAGCGTGATLTALDTMAQPVGVDLSVRAIQFCRKRGHALARAATSSVMGLR